MAEEKKTVLNVPENVEAVFAYLLGWISGLVFVLLEKENKFVRFHAFQSLIAFGILHILSLVLVFTIILPLIIGLISLALWIFLMISAYQGKKVKLPVVGDLAEKYA